MEVSVEMLYESDGIIRLGRVISGNGGKMGSSLSYFIPKAVVSCRGLASYNCPYVQCCKHGPTTVWVYLPNLKKHIIIRKRVIDGRIHHYRSISVHFSCLFYFFSSSLHFTIIGGGGETEKKRG